MAQIKVSALPTMDVMTANIVAVFTLVYNRSTLQELLKMAEWYTDAQKFCAQTAAIFNLDVNTVAGIAAALSPQLSWEKNKLNAVTLIAALVSNSEITGMQAYPANIEKAIAIYNGSSPLDVLGENSGRLTGKKVQSFYRNIMGFSDYVTIDRHATHIAMFGTANSDKSGDIGPTPKAYDVVAQAYRNAAKLLDLEPAQVQAITWTFKAMNGGKVD